MTQGNKAFLRSITFIAIITLRLLRELEISSDLQGLHRHM